MRVGLHQLSIADESGDSESDEDDADPSKAAAVVAASAGNAAVVKRLDMEVKRAKETKAAEAISSLVNYVAAVRFHGFEHAERESEY